MAKYQKYAEYKDSGVEWLDVIPSHWTSIAIKYLALDKNSLFLDGDWIESKDISDSGIRYITTGNVGAGFYKEQGSGFITESTFNKLSCTEVYVGDILISRLNLPIGRACIVPDLNNRIVTSVDNVIFRPDEEYHPKFLVYLFSGKEYFQNTENIARGATMQRISRGLLGNIRVVIPSKNEQTQIANFLDHETAQIDTLITKQEKLIALLKEKRQAVISHAVTKGLNPNVPMKDSGVEWLGEVPEHWAIPQIGYHAEVTKLTGFEYTNIWEPNDDGEIIALRGFNIQERYLDLNKTEKISQNLSFKLIRSKLYKGDLVLPCTGTLGNAALIDKDNTYHINQNIAKVTFDTDLFLPEFCLFWLTSQPFRQMIDFNNTSGMQPVLLIGDIRKLPILLSPLNEQKEIVQFLNNSTQKFDSLIMKAESAIQLMQERRTALISAAVTGKIDVRNWQHPNQKNKNHTELSA